MVVEPAIEQYKFYLKARLPKESMDAWLETLSDEERQEIEEFRSGSDKVAKEVCRMLSLNMGLIGAEMGLGVSEGIVKSKAKEFLDGR